MFLHKIIVSFQILLFLIPLQAEASSSSEIANSTTTLASTSTALPTINGSTFIPFVPSTTTVAVTNTSAVAVTNTSAVAVTNTSTVAVTNTSAVQATPSSTAVNVPSTSVTLPSTSPPPAKGALQAVVLTVARMTISEFEAKKNSFVSAVKTYVETYCGVGRECDEVTSRKRRATTVEQVYIVPGYPKESSTPGDLLVAIFVSTGGTKFLSKHILLTIVQEFRGNLSRVLGKEITGEGRLHLDEEDNRQQKKKTTESSSGFFGKTKILYIFFGAFAGVLVILGVCVFVTCWIGRKDDQENEVRPLTTSNLELVENQVNQGVRS